MIKRKKGAKTDQATAVVHTNTSDEEMRMQVEDRLQLGNPSWEKDSLKLSVPMDAESSQILGQLTGMFPGEKITLETTHGTFDIQSASQSSAAGYKTQKGTGERYDPMDPLDPKRS